MCPITLYLLSTASQTSTQPEPNLTLPNSIKTLNSFRLFGSWLSPHIVVVVASVSDPFLGALDGRRWWSDSITFGSHPCECMWGWMAVVVLLFTHHKWAAHILPRTYSLPRWHFKAPNISRKISSLTGLAWLPASVIPGDTVVKHLPVNSTNYDLLTASPNPDQTILYYRD